MIDHLGKRKIRQFKITKKIKRLTVTVYRIADIFSFLFHYKRVKRDLKNGRNILQEYRNAIANTKHLFLANKPSLTKYKSYRQSIDRSIGEAAVTSNGSKISMYTLFSADRARSLVLKKIIKCFESEQILKNYKNSTFNALNRYIERRIHTALTEKVYTNTQEFEAIIQRLLNEIKPLFNLELTPIDCWGNSKFTKIYKKYKSKIRKTIDTLSTLTQKDFNTINRHMQNDDAFALNIFLRHLEWREASQSGNALENKLTGKKAALYSQKIYRRRKLKKIFEEDKKRNDIYRQLKTDAERIQYLNMSIILGEPMSVSGVDIDPQYLRYQTVGRTMVNEGKGKKKYIISVERMDIVFERITEWIGDAELVWNSKGEKGSRVGREVYRKHHKKSWYMENLLWYQTYFYYALPLRRQVEKILDINTVIPSIEKTYSRILISHDVEIESLITRLCTEEINFNQFKDSMIEANKILEPIFNIEINENSRTTLTRKKNVTQSSFNKFRSQNTNPTPSTSKFRNNPSTPNVQTKLSRKPIARSTA